MDQRKQSGAGQNEREKPTRQAGGEERTPSKPETAPPIEREHETYAGILEEDDPSNPDRQ